MSEQLRPPRPREDDPPGGGLGSLFDQPGQHGTVVVRHGLHEEPLPVAGMTLGQIRRRYADRFDIDPRSTARLEGRDVGDDTVVRAGQTVTFARHIGEKGA